MTRTTMMSAHNRQILLVRAPTGALTPECFELVRAALPEPKDGEVLLKTRYVSIDAASRAMMRGPTYRDAIGTGTVMVGRAIGEVIESRHPDFQTGDVAYGELGWQEYAALPAQALTKQPALNPLSHLLSVYGVSGFTGYFGVLEAGQAKPGETILISAAAGSVGVFAGQVARIAGCRAVGIAGSDEKCRWLTEELGYDAAVNYKSGPLADSLRAACPSGVDVYFDNVGGATLEAALSLMNLQGRIACCGVMSAYDDAQPAQGLRGVPFQLVVKQLTMRGFRVGEFAARHPEALVRMRTWVDAGQLKVVEDIVDGFENLPAALIGLLHGENRGKRMVRIN